jgi:hypothetical protein
VTGADGRTTDCVAEEPDQLMFIKGDVLILLRELDDVDLASCEGVVGWVKKGEVEFDNVASSSSPKVSVESPSRDNLPRTVLTAPSPPAAAVDLPSAGNVHLGAPEQAKRASGPFEFGTPSQSPAIDHVDTPFFASSSEQYPHNDEYKRESITSIASSEALGGIGGFMMGDGANDNDNDQDKMEELTGGCCSKPD